MTLLQIVMLVAVGFGVAMVASGRWQGMADLEFDRPALALPVSADEIESVKFSLGVRGYRMDEVDAVLAACAQAIRERDEVIASMKASS